MNQLTENYYNLQTVVKISVYPKKKSEDWHWMPEERILFGQYLLHREGAYCLYDNRIHRTEEDLEKMNMYLEYGEIYKKPHLVLYFINEELNTTIYYNDKDTLYRELIKIKGKGGNWEKNYEENRDNSF